MQYLCDVKKYLLSLLNVVATLLLLSSCSDKYTIVGTSMHSVFDGKMVYLSNLIDGKDSSLDSCEIIHGQFTMSGPLDSVMCVTLDMGDFHLPLVLESGEIRVSSESQTVKVEGTELNEVLYKFLASRDSLIMILTDLPRRESQMILEGYDHDYILHTLGEAEADVRMAMDKLETNFIISNFDNVLGVSWFMELCNETYQRFGYPNTTPQIDEIYSRAPKDFQANPHVKKYMKLCDGK